MIWAGSLHQTKVMSGARPRHSLELALEVSELRYRRLFETAQDGILILNGEDGRIIDVNPFLLDLLDYPFDDIIGRQLWEIGLFEDIAANKVAFAKLQTEEFIRYENHPLRTKSGKVVAVVVVEVSDTGIGIPADALARIFSPFEQGDSSIHSRFGGLGLGLSIAHTLMNAQGGTLEAASEGLDRGATFTARFKLDEPSSAGPPETVDSPEVSGVGMHILLVEDHEDARRALSILLGSRGYEVNVAANMEAALKLGARHHFDMLIADVGLPDGNGLELFAKIKQNSPDLQGIALSGYGRPEDIAEAQKAGFFSHLIKPVQFSELRRIIEGRLPKAKAASLRRLRE